MKNLLLLFALTMLSVGAYARDFTSVYSDITTHSTMITTVTGTIDMHEEWQGDRTIRVDSAVLVPLVDADDQPVYDPNNPGQQLYGLVVTDLDRTETAVTGNNDIVGGTFGYTSTAISSGKSHEASSNGTGSGGGFRTTNIKTSNHTGEHTLTTRVTGAYTQDQTSATYVDFDPISQTYDQVYDTEVAYSHTNEDSLTPFTNDRDFTYIVDAASNSETTIDEYYSRSYNDSY